MKYRSLLTYLLISGMGKISLYAYTWDYFDVGGIAENFGKIAPLEFDGALNSSTATLYHTIINTAHLQAGLDDIVFYNSAAATQPNLVHYLNNNVASQAGSLAYIHTNKLTIEDIKVSSEDTQIIFDKPNSTMQLNLKNGTFDSAIAPIFIAPNPLQINVGSTAHGSTSTLRRFTADISSPTTITLDPGTTLKILDSGDAYSADYLRFRESAQINVNSGSTFIVDSSKVVLDKGSINVNAGTVSTQGSNSYLKTYDMKLENGSNLNVGLSTNLVSITNALTLNNSSINTLRTVEVADLYVIGTSSISGGGTFIAESTLPSGASFTLNLDNVTFKTGELFDIYGSTININNGSIFEGLKTGSLFMRGTIINVNDGQLVLNGPSAVEDKATINIFNGSQMFIGRGASLVLDTTNHTTVNAASGSAITVLGELTGKGYIGAAGSEIDIQSTDNQGTKINGFISPGFEQYTNSSYRIGTITTDAKLFIEAEGYPAYISSQSNIDNLKNIGYSGGIYTVDIDPNHTQTSDKIAYGQGNVDLTFMEHILVQTPNAALSADDLHQKEFTVIEAQNSLVSGTILTGYNSYEPNDIVVVQDASIPALINFTVIDNNTNSKPDVTLLAEKNIVNLQKKTDPSRVNLTASASLLTNVYNTTSTTGTINTALNTLTNAQFVPSLNSIHAEPFSSYMTVSLEQLDWVMSSVMAKTFNHFENSKNFWSDISYVNGNVDGDNSLGSYKYTINSLLIGSDLMKNEVANVGIYTGFTHQKMGEHDNAIQDFKSDNFHIGTYFYNKGIDENLVLTGLLGYSYSKHQSSRYTELGSYSGRQNADFNGNSFYGAVETSYNAGHYGTVTLLPNIGLQYAYVSQDKVQESGNDLRLIVDKSSTNMLVSFIGMDLLFDSFEKMDYLSPMMFFRYEHDWKAKKEDSHKMTSALAIQPNFKETFVGQNRGAENFVFGAGLKANKIKDFEFNIGVFSSRSEHGNEVSAAADIVYRF